MPSRRSRRRAAVSLPDQSKAAIGRTGRPVSLRHHVGVVHVPLAYLEADIDVIRRSPSQDGRIELIARRPEVDRREVVVEARFDLSVANLPPGTRLEVGSALLQVTAIPHRGCGKFGKRFGADALKFVNSVLLKRLASWSSR